jgi:UDP-N-acetylmuramate--alanine ligase
MDGFAEALSKLDEVILLPVYPAREMPIEGITSEILAKKIVSRYPVRVVQKEDLIRLVSERVKAFEETIIMTLGAGDIDRLVGEMATQLNKM